MNLLFLIPLISALSAAQQHIPNSASPIASSTSSRNVTAQTSIPNLISPPASIPDIPDNRTITVTNSCDEDIWPAILTTNNTGPYTQGFYLPPQKSLQLWISNDWIGRIWARTNCS